MKRKMIVTGLIGTFIVIFGYISYTQILPQEIENAPDWLRLEEALEQASAEEGDKLILIDIYEVGCRFCRQMEREVYPSESIRTLIDQQFYPVKVNGNSSDRLRYNGEEMTKQEFAGKMGVTAYPFTVVMDREGNVLSTRRGYMGVSELSRFLNNARQDA